MNGLRLVAILYFYFADVDPEKGWDQKCYVYEVGDWQGEPQESNEMAPRWWDANEIPYDEMWPADRHWIEPVLKGNLLTGYFLFTSKDECLDYQISVGKLVDE